MELINQTMERIAQFGEVINWSQNWEVYTGVVALLVVVQYVTSGLIKWGLLAAIILLYWAYIAGELVPFIEAIRMYLPSWFFGYEARY